MGPAKQRRATGFRRVLGGLREAWLAVGLTLLALALAEGAVRLALALRRPAPDARIQADSYPAEPWVAELYAENARSARMRWESYVYWRRLPFAGSQINVDQRGLRRTWRPPAAVGKPAAAIRRNFFGLAGDEFRLLRLLRNVNAFDALRRRIRDAERFAIDGRNLLFLRSHDALQRRVANFVYAGLD